MYVTHVRCRVQATYDERDGGELLVQLPEMALLKNSTPEDDVVPTKAPALFSAQRRRNGKSMAPDDKQ